MMTNKILLTKASELSYRLAYYVQIFVVIWLTGMKLQQNTVLF